MPSTTNSETIEKGKRSGRRFLIRFENETELKKVRRAAAREQASTKKQMGKRFPNTSLFIAEAAVEKADQILKAEEK